MQFGFKQNFGCAEALFALKTTINHFIANGSSVFAASLDLSKAFDRVDHFKLYNSMLSTGIQVYVVNVICNWYNIPLVSVRWNDGLSTSFTVGSGVRQSSALSSAIFNVFMNLFISNFKTLGHGCCINKLLSWLLPIC